MYLWTGVVRAVQAHTEQELYATLVLKIVTNWLIINAFEFNLQVENISKVK